MNKESKGGNGIDIMERLNILISSDFINEEEYMDLLKVLDIFRNKYGYDICEENGGMMITHMAAAFRRQRTGESVAPLSDKIVSGIEKSPHFSKAKIILDEITMHIKSSVCEKEGEYFLLHICSFLRSVQ